MRVKKKSKEKVKKLAEQFIRNSPPLCKDHKPEGLPIDAPENVDVSENHPSYKFEKLVEKEVTRLNTIQCEKRVVRAEIRGVLRSSFTEVFYSDADKRSCIQCYEERKKSDSDVGIRMEVPDKYDNIDKR